MTDQDSKVILQLLRDSELARERAGRRAKWANLWAELRSKDGWLIIGWMAVGLFLSCAFFPYGIFSFVFMAPFAEHYVSKWRRERQEGTGRHDG